MPLSGLISWADDSTLHVLLAAAVGVLLALLTHRISAKVVLRLTRSLPISNRTAQQCRAPALLLMPLMALQAVWQVAPDTFPLIAGVRHVNVLLLLAGLTWLGLRAARGVAQGVIGLYPLNVQDNLNARRIHTQTRMLSRTAMFIILLAGLSLILMTFPEARQIGASLLASAGVVGIVAGIAARPIFSNLIAGLQIALAQPFRLDDVLIIQGEWGRVEEITGTYVVLKIWDERRLVIPLQWFIENPFQNWTRQSAQIIGTVFIWVDYRMPLAPLREAARLACEAAPEWDRRLCLLQVVEAGERGMQLRVLVTSSDSSLNWDLRCKVREALVDVMQRDWPGHLPLMRAEVGERSGAGPDASPLV
ncbi:MAG: MscS Mechanosensitive ion channel [Polaromonas sp.]|jgi:small-conductance mechanosensitive channel|nr:MscS Mechanosensitive ion channel [Polaromonas sp.]MDB5844152.1 MscS Mechanosensitive ion channel [Polaromonas sp.]MDB5938728.1 MscS Mechanosensitive ion channel [Polaromonas sp.]